jgi:hypothetical protein
MYLAHTMHTILQTYEPRVDKLMIELIDYYGN